VSIYRFFKRNRPLPKARDAAVEAYSNRDRKIARILFEIADDVDKAIHAGNDQIRYHLRAEDIPVRVELIDRLQQRGYVITHDQLEGDEDRYGLNLTIAFAAMRREMPR